MIEYFLKLPSVLQTVLINSSFLFGIVALYIGARFGINIKSGKFSLFFGKAKEEKAKSKHSGCRNAHDAFESLHKIRQNERRIFELRYMESIKAQMNLVEGTSKSIISRLLRIYADILKGMNYPDPIKTNSCQSYMALLKIIETRVNDKMRLFIRENHLAEKSEQEFEIYVNSRFEDLRNHVTETLNDLYYYDKDITRATLYDANVDKISELSSLVKTCFHGCRVIATQTRDQIEKIERESSTIFNSFLES